MDKFIYNMDLQNKERFTEGQLGLIDGLLEGLGLRGAGKRFGVSHATIAVRLEEVRSLLTEEEWDEFEVEREVAKAMKALKRIKANRSKRKEKKWKLYKS